jgi:hypothetical protein
MTNVYLIYVKSPKGPSPQKVETIPINSHGRSLPALSKHQLKQDEWPLPLKMLQSLYPAPKVDND